MKNIAFRVDDPRSYRKAGSRSIIELTGAAGNNDLYIQKRKLELLVAAIVSKENVNLSGPTGSGKTALIEALSLVPDNFIPGCRELGFPEKPLKTFPGEMTQFDTPSELYRIRALQDGNTFYEDSIIFRSIAEARSIKDTHYAVIWCRELGRCQNGVQGALLNIISRGDILTADGRRIPSEGISFLTDNNYQAADDAVHSLCVFDDALRRRFSINITLDYLPAETEEIILRNLASREGLGADEKNLMRLVLLGEKIRAARADGRFQSLAPPTIHGYLGALRLQALLPSYLLQDVLEHSILGNASSEDRKLFPALYHEVFGAEAVCSEEDVAIAGDLL